MAPPLNNITTRKANRRGKHNKKSKLMKVGLLRLSVYKP